MLQDNVINKQPVILAKIFALTLQPGHPDQITIDSLAKSLMTIPIDYGIITGPIGGGARYSDWEGHNLTPILEALAEREITTFWIPDSTIPPGIIPDHYEKGKKFLDFKHLRAKWAVLPSASDSIKDLVLADLHQYHSEDSSKVFEKMYAKYGGLNVATIAIAKLRELELETKALRAFYF